MAVMYRRRRNFIITDQLILNIYVNVVLVPEFIYAVLLYPASLCVFLTLLVFAPVIRDIAVPDRFVFIPRITLFGSRDWPFLAENPF